MLKTQAWERLHDSDYCSRLTMDQFYDLMVRAGYDEDTAQEAASQRGYERICAGVTA